MATNARSVLMITRPFVLSPRSIRFAVMSGRSSSSGHRPSNTIQNFRSIPHLKYNKTLTKSLWELYGFMVDLPMMCVRVFTISCTKRYFRLCMKNVYNTFLQQQQQQQRKQTMFCARALSFVRFCPGSLTGNSPHTEPAKKKCAYRVRTQHTQRKKSTAHAWRRLRRRWRRKSRVLAMSTASTRI